MIPILTLIVPLSLCTVTPGALRAHASRGTRVVRLGERSCLERRTFSRTSCGPILDTVVVTSDGAGLSGATVTVNSSEVAK